MVVALLTARSLPIPEDPGSNPVIGNIYKENEKRKRKKKKKQEKRGKKNKFKGSVATLLRNKPL